MILKIQNGVNWRLWDGLIDISYRVMALDEPICCRDDCIDLTKPIEPLTQIPGTTEVHRTSYEIWAKTRKGDMQILAYEPIYLLNDEGKTIEKL
jgi:hypothetical protein